MKQSTQKLNLAILHMATQNKKQLQNTLFRNDILIKVWLSVPLEHKHKYISKNTI